MGHLVGAWWAANWGVHDGLLTGGCYPPSPKKKKTVGPLTRMTDCNCPVLPPPSPPLKKKKAAGPLTRMMDRNWPKLKEVDPDSVPIPPDAEFDIDHHQVGGGGGERGAGV